MEEQSKTGFFSKFKPWVLTLAVGLAVFSAFIFGTAVGQGKIKFGSAFDRFLAETSDTSANTDNGNLPDDLEYSSVEQVYDVLKKSYDGELDETSLLDGLKQGLASATGDPYTEYLNADAAQDFKDELNGTFTGIGAELGKEENFIVIVAPIEGFPAEKAGLRPKDIITKIDGETAYNLSITEAVKKIRGPKGEKVKLTIVRNESEQLEFEIIRDEIKIPSVKSEILNGNIGYIKISRFSEDTHDLSRQAAANFKNSGVRSVILDLRGNPGGLLDTSVDIASLWLEPGKVVVEEKRGAVLVKTLDSKGTPLLAGLPTVVLINQGSASASEIVAGALKDHGAATLIGEASFGKGSVQSLERLLNGSLLKVTIARWFTPKGKNIDKEGIAPDKTIEMTDDDFEADKDPQLEAAKEFLR